MGEGLQASIGQETKDSHWIPVEQQGTVQACQKQLVPWEMGQQPSLLNSYRASALQLDTVPTMGHLQTHKVTPYSGILEQRTKKYHLANAQQLLTVVSHHFCILTMK